MNSTLVKLADNHLSIPLAPPRVLHLLNHGLKSYYFKRYEYIPLRSDVLWRIKTGIVRTMTWDEDGNQIILGLWNEGDIVGSLMSTLDPYQMQCLNDVEVEILPSILWEQASSAIIDHCQQTQQLLNIAHCRTTDVKLKKFLIWLSRKFGKSCDRGMTICLKLTHQDIADTISSTRVTMTRSLNQLRLQGLLSWENHYLTLHQNFPERSFSSLQESPI
ncbi:Crp/Fnr family transcriptional regulator [Pseudanabaena sp. UWO311]|uniref:Crp/Fnr family transcriptional regulator n=1 Tax=Pseudanabaena sp. UWO311 TaxID=2487337 RepID=UPI00115AD805|nr:Crp/Fnr family transcriptional regulator [Pseudanabaena sp. UWO311]TYQ23672.1 Crp/Fnr family transcriptional regulator [Pseudanabaena sp. UWO311]